MVKGSIMRIILLILILCFPVAGLTANTGMTVTYSPSTSWLTSGNKSYMNLELATVTAKRRISVRLFSDKTLIAEMWDDPTGDRTYIIGVGMTGKAITHITGQAMAYEAGPWIAGAAYSVGDKISVGEYPSPYYWWEATRAGTTGATEPIWPDMHQFTLALTKTINAGDAVDNGDGTVTIPMGANLFKTGDAVTITGSVNYDGDYTLPNQATATESNILITATYTAETFTGTETVQITGAKAIDNGDGTVNLPLPAHGYVAGQTVTISNSTNYDGNYTLATQSNPDQLTITATYVAEPMAGASVIATPIDDPDGSGVEWTFTTGTQEIFYSESTGRKIGRVVGDRLQLSGSKFIIRNQ